MKTEIKPTHNIHTPGTTYPVMVYGNMLNDGYTEITYRTLDQRIEIVQKEHHFILYRPGTRSMAERFDPMDVTVEPLTDFGKMLTERANGAPTVNLPDVSDLATKPRSAIIEHKFTYHPPKPGQQALFEQITHATKELAHLINEVCPTNQEKFHAIEALQMTRMWANASIALGDYTSFDRLAKLQQRARPTTPPNQT